MAKSKCFSKKFVRILSLLSYNTLNTEDKQLMFEVTRRPLKVFLCHASGDKPQVRALYKRLIAEGVDAWLDQEKLLPGQNWRVEIPRAVKESDVVVICLSNNSITKEGYIQKEIKFALDVADEKPEGSIFLIPARLEECVVPDKLSVWQWVDLYENNGFVKLLRSLKLRADRVGAIIESASDVEDDAEAERKLNQLYTEGLAAFYTEDWNKACQRFQAILSERPNHKNAAEKLEEAERQRDLSRLYDQATDALQSEDWGTAIKLLEDIFGKSNDYKDASQLLKNARRQKRLGELYKEAKTLHAAQKWQAVIKVFDQISVVDPAYQDVDGLLTSAQNELAELKRLAELNALYTNAVNEMDSGRWYEARKLLEQVHKLQIGFLETERLLRKVEDEIIKIEENKRRNDQINTLYEQANSLVRSKNWRKALDKMREIQKLDERFVDKDGIVEKVNFELAKEEQEALKQNDLAAKYSEAVSLLKEGKYQEALDKWQEVKSIDPKYPDRQRVQITARRKLAESGNSLPSHIRLVITKPMWVLSVFIVIGVVVVASLNLFRKRESEAPVSTAATLSVIGSTSVVSTISARTDTSEPSLEPSSTVTPTSTTGLLMYEDFDGPSLGKEYVSFQYPNNGTPNYTFETLDGASVIRLKNKLGDLQIKAWEISKVFDIYSKPVRVEVRFNTVLQSYTTSIDGFIQIWMIANDGSGDYATGLFAGANGTDRNFQGVPFDFEDYTWYRLVITGTKEQNYRTSIFDDTLTSELVGVDMNRDPELFRSGMKIGLAQWMGTPERVAPVDVAIDWIKVTINP